MTSRPGRAARAGFVLLVALALAVVPWSRVSGASRTLASPSNAQLLLGAVRAVAHQLVYQAPLTPGMRVALRADAGEGVESDVADALVMALNQRHIECVVLPPLAGGETALAAPAAPAADTTAAVPKSADMQSLGAYARLQAERVAQAARADSIARARGAAPETPAERPSAASVLANGGVTGSLPVLTYRVPEARVDYVRIFRGGLFGAERIERRASARVALRLQSPGSDAVRWSASADTTISDVVMRSEITALEDRQRPETRPLAPTSNLKKVVEPVLVVVLIAGLVSLFYQNRP
jgi:hypothetical protein